jgi:large subunit ribosomal protein L27Ae
MRDFHKLPNRTYQPAVNLDRLWSLVTEQHRLAYKDKKDVAPVIDVVRAVSLK